jgi:hypothetical protein
VVGDDEESLAHDGVTDVVRVGQTVRRPVRPFTETVQQYLRHVRFHGAGFVPEALGYDDLGREVVEFIDGEVPIEPLPAWATSDHVLVILAGMIRRLHDAAAGWVPPRDAVWGGIPGAAAAKPALGRATELVSHQDYCPGNVVFRDGAPVGLIDFDLARPTTREDDCVNALYWWAPLLHPDDRAPSLRQSDVAMRVRLFADSYGMTREQSSRIVPIAVERARTSYVTMRVAADVDPVFARWWEDGLKERTPRALQWIEQESTALPAALLDGR